ncbi:putative ERG5-C-22 sterol desaturase [Cantharellus anzutake]|uniref:putative ERG5-C-22 sterol desaturase n=1 Tax=Cantharellus anzutake TaxID=1750568 RepID=UPI001905C024|nr:putative ERG5-C-22 sterol desaturase [Cantharellus anzutake]KAF8344248.1 putative ERG5-C-22 sterol desaturase [Cantharellus anzutake]
MTSFFRASPAILSYASQPVSPSLDGSNAPSFFASLKSSVDPFWTSNTVLTVVGTTILLLLVLEQTNYRIKKSWLPGEKWTIPIIGQFVDSMYPSLENYQKQWDMGPLSALSVFNIFIVMASTNQYTRRILNSPLYAGPCLVHSAKKVLEPDNWVFLNGKAHADYRRMLNALFTRKSLAIYLKTQDDIARKTFKKWLESDQSLTHSDIMTSVRDFNMETSLRVFCGPHIPEHAVRLITGQYWKITKALELVNFPLALPGTKIWGAVQARKEAMKWLEGAAKASKEAMRRGEEVKCLIDEWTREMILASESEGEAKYKMDFSDHEIAQVVLSFLFASQDAMSSGIIYMFQHLADYPDILAKIREEQIRVRGGDLESPMNLEWLDEMPYIRACVKESLRVKPPVTMVPYVAHKDFPISESYTVPKGSMVIPSLYPSLLDENVYPDPHKFIPERWLDENSSANQNPAHYLVFGAGPHRCIGQEYTTMNMATALGTAAIMMDWDHLKTPKSDKVQIIATIFPQDGCLLKFTPRNST